VSKISIGTVQFGLDYGVANQSGKVSFEEVQRILKLALDNKIESLDTAILYGESESVLGKCDIDNFQIVTKLPEISTDEGAINSCIEKYVTESLQRLNVNRVYGLLLHRPAQLMQHGGEVVYKTLETLKKNELIEKIGVSIYQPEELENLIDKFDIGLIQLPLNIIDRRLIDTGWLSKLHDRGVEIHVRSIFLQGLLLMPYGQRPDKFTQWDSLWKKWDVWLRQNNLTAVEAAIRYALSIPEISKVVVGVDSVTQLKEIMVAADGELPAIPDDMFTNDTLLLNPSNWSGL